MKGIWRGIERWIGLLVLGGCGGGSLPPVPQEGPSQAPDYVVEAPVLTVMDASGHPHYRLVARSLAHHLDKALTEVEAPDLTLLTSPPWRVQAKRGRILDRGEEVFLSGEVVIHRGGTTPILIRTRDLTVYPKAERAETDRPVEAAIGPHRIEAVGFEGDLPRGRLIFRSHVEARYVPLP